jgi:hypothetical protein
MTFNKVKAFGLNNEIKFTIKSWQMDHSYTLPFDWLRHCNWQAGGELLQTLAKIVYLF